MSVFTHGYRKNLLVVGIAALATASLAACGNTEAGPTTTTSNVAASAPTKNATAPTTNATATNAPKETEKTTEEKKAGEEKPEEKKPEEKKTEGKTEGGSNKTVTCTGANTKVVVSKVSNPVNHLLITATNTGKTLCNAYKAPLLRLDDAQSSTQINDDSQPQAVMTIKPGESVYAGLTTSSAAGDGTGGFTARKLEVHFDSRDGSGSVDPHATWTFKSGVYVDSAAQVTFWQSSVSEALTW
jgi:hypothetical protein